MDVVTYRILIDVHLRDAEFLKGQIVTRTEMGPYAFVLLHYELAKLVAVEQTVQIAA